MSTYKKDIVKAITVVLLVAVLSVATYSLFPDVLPQLTYGTGIAIQDDGLATKDFINRTLEAGGGYTSIEYSPTVHLTFENGSKSSYSQSMNLTTETWATEATVNASGLQEFRVDWGVGWGARGSFSTEFETLVAAGNFSWYGIYNKGSEINTALHVDSNRTDLGTRFENNVLLVFNLNSTTIARALRIIHPIEMEYWPVPPDLQRVSRDTGACWGTEGWTMQTVRILQMVGQSKSASISFEGSAWLDGNYTVTENGIAKNATMNSTKNVSFGRIDMAFESGRICTLSFKFNAIDIILFARPEE